MADTAPTAPETAPRGKGNSGSSLFKFHILIHFYSIIFDVLRFTTDFISFYVLRPLFARRPCSPSTEVLARGVRVSRCPASTLPSASSDSAAPASQCNAKQLNAKPSLLQSHKLIGAQLRRHQKNDEKCSLEDSKDRPSGCFAPKLPLSRARS